MQLAISGQLLAGKGRQQTFPGAKPVFQISLVYFVFADG
jgi:hypothetical protein